MRSNCALIRVASTMLSIIGAAIVLAGVFRPISAQALSSPPTSDWCGTQEAWARKPAAMRAAAAGICDVGPCDVPATRDSWIPTGSTTITVYKIYFNVFRNDDGSFPACTAADVDSQMVWLNRDYLVHRIQFEMTGMRFVNSSRFRTITVASEFDAMKAMYAVKPDSQCNIYVVAVNVGGKVYSFATFPWDPDALSVYGGIVMNRTQFPPYENHTTTHEMGHCLGLWHTFHGVSEVGQCDACYESAGSPSDVTGDFCADTPPTPLSYACGNPGGSDVCSGFAWGNTDYTNHMSYGSCSNHFTSQQAGRMSCWSYDKLQAWMSGVRFTSDLIFGPAPLTVAFEGNTAQQATSWKWDFHDGDSSTLQNPTHTFNAGNYDVTLSIESAGGPFSVTKPGYIWAHADTFAIANVLGNAGKKTRVDISIKNNLPLTRIVIPFTWAGPYNVFFDTVLNTGTRTAGWALPPPIQIDALNKRRTYEINFAAPGGAGTFLPAGEGPIMSVYLWPVNTMPQGASTPVEVLAYGYQTPTFEAQPGIYFGGSVAGSITICLAGDVNNDDIGPDISDLTGLIGFLYLGGGTPPVLAKADVDGTNGVDIGDITALIAYLFLSGPKLTCGL
jgi:PKD repeat protein